MDIHVQEIHSGVLNPFIPSIFKVHINCKQYVWVALYIYLSHDVTSGSVIAS